MRARVRTKNIFSDLGFGAAEAEELLAKSVLIEAVADTIGRRELTSVAPTNQRSPKFCAGAWRA